MNDDLEFNISNLDIVKNLLHKMIENIIFIINGLHELTKQVMIYNNLINKNDIYSKNQTINTIELLWNEIVYNIETSSYNNIYFYLVNDIYQIGLDVFNLNTLNTYISVDKKSNYENNVSYIYQLITKNEGVTGSDKILFKYLSLDCKNRDWNINQFSEDHNTVSFEKGIYIKVNSGYYFKKGVCLFISVKCERNVLFKYKNHDIIIKIHKIITPDTIIKMSLSINDIILNIESLIKRLSDYQDYLSSINIYIDSISLNYKNQEYNLVQKKKKENNQNISIFSKIKQAFGIFDN